MSLLRNILSFIDGLSRQITLLLNIPWAKTYVFILIAVIAFSLLYTLLKRALKPLSAFLLEPLRLLRRDLREKARSNAEKKAIKKQIRRAVRAKDFKSAAGLYQSLNEPADAARLYIEAKEYSSAARIYEDLGNFEKAALFFSEADNNTKAAENFLRIEDYRSAAPLYEKAGFLQKAAEVYEKAGAYERAAELYEMCFVEEGPRGALQSAGERYARKSGGLFQKAGHPSKAIHILIRGNLFDEAALLHEAKGDYADAADCYVRSGNLERAAECYQRAGVSQKYNEIMSVLHYKKGLVPEAASFAEKAGDLTRAAEMFAEAGEYSRAGKLLTQKGSFTDAAEMFLKGDDFSGAAEAFEKGGEYVFAAEAHVKAGAPPLRAAELYEKGGDYFHAGRLLLQLDLADSALAALQKTPADSVHYKSASLLIGKIFLQKGMTELAAEKLTKVIGSEHVTASNLEHYYYLARCYEISGKREKAKATYEKILAEDYHFSDVSQRLARLSQQPGGTPARKPKTGSE